MRRIWRRCCALLVPLYGQSYAYCNSDHQRLRTEGGHAEDRSDEDPIVIIGGGVMGMTTAKHLIENSTRKVVLIDANHAVRGSWGESRASHLTIEDPVLLNMGLHSIPAYQELHRRQ